jgi:hypothetical protein
MEVAYQRKDIRGSGARYSADARYAICEKLGYTTCLSLYGFK